MLRWTILLLLVGFGPSSVIGASPTLWREGFQSLVRSLRPGPAVREAGQSAWRAQLDAPTRHGLQLIEQLGPAGRQILRQAGDQTPAIAAFIGRQGGHQAQRALALVRDPRRLHLILRHGDEAGRAMLKHPGLAEDLIRAGGRDAAAVLLHCSTRQARQLWQLARQGIINEQSIAQGFWRVLRRYGQRAVAFCWRHRRPLLIGSVLTAFLADPEAFLDGSRELLVEPLHERGWLWPLVVFALVLLIGPWTLLRCALSGVRVLRHKLHPHGGVPRAERTGCSPSP